MELIQTRLPRSQEAYFCPPSTNKQNLTEEGKKTSGSGIAKHIILERDYIRRLAVIVLKSAIKKPWLGVKLGI